MRRRHFIASAAAVAVMPVLPSFAKEAPSLDEVLDRLGEIGHVHYRGQWGPLPDADGVEKAHLIIVSEVPYAGSTGGTLLGKHAFVAWYDGEELDYEEVRRAFNADIGSYTAGGYRVGSGPYGTYDLLKAASA